MIVVPEDGRLGIVTQADHAHLAGEVLSLWRADGLPENPRRPDVLFAAREHDNGWREADSAPRVDPDTGRPHDFRSLPDGPRIEIWRRGTERYAGSRPYATLLVCRHARALHADRRGDARWEEELFEPLDELEEDLAEAVEALRVEGMAAGAAGGGGDAAGFLDPEETEADYRLVRLADVVSLAACGGWTEPVEVPGAGAATYRVEPAADRVLLDPFPLAGTTTFRVRRRTVTDRPYRSSVDLIGELAAARWGTVDIRLAPAGV